MTKHNRSPTISPPGDYWLALFYGLIGGAAVISLVGGVGAWPAGLDGEISFGVLGAVLGGVAGAIGGPLLYAITCKHFSPKHYKAVVLSATVWGTTAAFLGSLIEEGNGIFVGWLMAVLAAVVTAGLILWELTMQRRRP